MCTDGVPCWQMPESMESDSQPGESLEDYIERLLIEQGCDPEDLKIVEP